MGSSQFKLIESEIKRSVSAENLISIILFGSAVESNKSAQDYDILIVTKKMLSHDWILAGEIKYHLLGKVDKPLDIVFMEERDLGYTSPFIFEVGRKSRMLYGKNILPRFRKVSKSVKVLAEGGKPFGWQIAE